VLTLELVNNNIMLPKLPNVWETSYYYIVWKIWITEFLNSSSFIKFIIKTEVSLIDY